MHEVNPLKSALDVMNECITDLNVPQFDTLDFVWNNMQFKASCDKFGSNGGAVKLAATVGRLYYTVEDKRLRTESIKQLFRSNHNIDGTYKLERDGSVSFTSLTTVKEKISGPALLKALTVILMESSEHLNNLRSYLKAV